MLIITMSGVLLIAGGMTVSGVWAVARISGSVDRLGDKVDNLDQGVQGLSDSVNKLDGRLDDHSERIAALEGKGVCG